LDDNSTTLTVVAGTNVSGSAPDMLNKPCGIFVDINLDLYVADFGNDRIQLFGLGRSYAITVAGILSSSTTITLNGPTGIVLDADKYLFIVDSGNNRIVGSGPDGFRCLAGCDGNGSASNQLSQPFSLSFDIDGNMFVTDTLNDRIRKFILFTNSCIKCEYLVRR
jgi:sugar lactone lactonase YvrE